MIYIEGKNGNLHLNSNLILRDCELFHRKNGLGFYQEALCHKLSGGIQTGEEPRSIWLPAETEELRQKIRQGESTMVVGQLGAGKSALLYGLRSGYRANANPYLYVDGHFMNTTPQKIDAALDWAEKTEAVVCWDSFDYLAARSRRVRKTPIERHRERSLAIIASVQQFVEGGGTFVGTSHSEPWLQSYGDDQMINGPWGEFVGSINQHDVKGRFDTPEELMAFYTSTKMPKEEATYMSRLCNNQPLAEYFTQSQSDPEIRSIYGDAAIPEAVEAIRSYRLSKLFALDPSSQDVRTSLTRMVQGEITEAEYAAILGRFIFEKNRETKIKMGIITG